jgi:hypothetical protein
MQLDRKDAQTPTQRALFEAVDAAARPTFTGRIIVEVVAGKSLRLTTVKEDVAVRVDCGTF